MGLDLYIQALIKDNKTGRIISNPYENGFLKYAGGAAMTLVILLIK